MSASSLVRAAASWPSGESFGWKLWASAERVSAGVLLALLWPLLLAVGGMTFALSRRSPLVAHLRVGREGAPLWVLKFRTMWGNGEARRGARWIERIADEAGPSLKRSGDSRVSSRFARFCRRYSIDELPQLAHVVTGDLSLVGPRPLTGAELRAHYGDGAREILRLKPGITGLWQVMGRSRLTYRQRRRLDLFYVRKRSPWLNLWILARTVPVMLSGRGAW